MEDKWLKRICRNCGLTRGAHCATRYYSDFYKRVIPLEACPGHQGRMDWDQGCDTIFEATEEFRDVPPNTPHKLLKEKALGSGHEETPAETRRSDKGRVS